MKKKTFLPLISSLALFSGPALLVAACSSDITRYEGALPSDLEDRILFDFVGVNYNVNAKSQFSSAFKTGMDFIKKEVEGIMAQQEFYNFFVGKLNYTRDEANAAFIKIKNKIGLNLLASEYFNTVNQGISFDSKMPNKLIFQTNNWHLGGTTKLNYENSEFYGNPDYNPDTIFSPSYLYENLGDAKTDEIIQTVATRADTNYNKDISALTKDKLTWDDGDTPDQKPPQDKDVEKYQLKLERFKWWLRFRYQQYYVSKILPQLNETLFTMANILNSILTINNQNNKPKIQIDNTNYAGQLQSWATNSSQPWSTKYHFVWDYTTNIERAQELHNQINAGNPLPTLINNTSGDLSLNPEFLTLMSSSEETIKNAVDPVFGVNSYISDTSSKVYNNAILKTQTETPVPDSWIDGEDGFHYWGQNNKGSFVYIAPIYWIDVVQNLDFNYYRDNNITNDSLTVTNNSWLTYWNNAPNDKISSSDFSTFIRGPQVAASNPRDEKYNYYQNMKWNTFWQMIYFIAANDDTNTNKEVAKNNFSTAAKALFPKFIKKENIYNIDFWNAVKEYY